MVVVWAWGLFGFAIDVSDDDIVFLKARPHWAAHTSLDLHSRGWPGTQRGPLVSVC